MNPHFFDDGSAAPCRFSNQFTGPELLQHFNHWRIPYETDIHPDLLPYRGCDRSSNTFVRTVFWMNCLQKGNWDAILRRHHMILTCEAYTER
jgi:hypothetical protein